MLSVFGDHQPMPPEEPATAPHVATSAASGIVPPAAATLSAVAPTEP